MKKRSLNKIKQIVSIGMSCIMAGSTCNLPMMLHAEEVQTKVLCRVRLDKRVAALSELGIYYPLSEMQDLASMRQLFEQTLGAVTKHDRENESALLETLEQYFACGCNLRMTAEKMFLHKNSVSYRLHKVEELTGRSMDDIQFRLELQLCLLYCRLI